MTHGTYLTLIVVTAATESAFTQIAWSGVGHISKILSALEAALSGHPLLNLRRHLHESKLLISQMYLPLEVIQVITETDND